MRDWFPKLPSYVAFVQRLNKIADVFAPLLEIIQVEQEQTRLGGTQSLLVDSFPVALAKQGHRFKACVAPELATHGYCSTNMSITYLYVVEKLYFYGVKVHVLGRKQTATLPSPEYIGVAPAGDHDGKVFDQIHPLLSDEDMFGDKAYQRSDAKEVEQNQNLTVLTPVKKKKGQKYLDADEQWLSTAVSTVRQPIETLFGWIEEKTGIECAGKVRSYQGLLVHVFGRLAAAMFFWNKLRICS